MQKEGNAERGRRDSLISTDQHISGEVSSACGSGRVPIIKEAC
jgi:hypothetical protein